MPVCPICGCRQKRWLEPEEVALVFRSSSRTITRAIASGRLKAVKFGRSWRIEHESLDKLVESSSLGHVAEKGE